MKISHSRFIRTIGALALPLVLLALSNPLDIMAASPRSALSSVSSVNAAVAPVTTSALRDAMRKLWEDHVTWMRLYTGV